MVYRISLPQKWMNMVDAPVGAKGNPILRDPKRGLEALGILGAPGDDAWMNRGKTYGFLGFYNIYIYISMVFK